MKEPPPLEDEAPHVNARRRSRLPRRGVDLANEYNARTFEARKRLANEYDASYLRGEDGGDSSPPH